MHKNTIRGTISRMVTIAEIALLAGEDEESVRAILRIGWTPNLLAVAGKVSANYTRHKAEKLFKGVKVNGGWIISREVGDAWLKKRGIVIEE